MLRCVIEVLRNMAAHGGRDTERTFTGVRAAIRYACQETPLLPDALNAAVK